MPLSSPVHPAIRPATDDDGAGIAALIAAVFAEYEDCPFVPEEFPELAAPAAAYAARGGRMWVVAPADDPGRILGCLAVFRHFEPGTFELGKVYLHPDLRGGGFAAGLLALAVDHARGQGGTRLVLWSDTRFARGHAFYGKHGFGRMAGLRALHDVGRSLEFGFVRDLDAPGP